MEFSGRIDIEQEDREPRVSDSQWKQFITPAMNVCETRIQVSLCSAERERERQKEEQRTKGKKERGRERREAALYLLSLFTGEVRGMEGDNLDTLVFGAPQPAILLLCPPALRPPGTPSEEG